jgi:hypothetical protein
MEDWEWLDSLLHGIDTVENEDPGGWWETSAGAEFGALKLSALKDAITRRYSA